MNLAEALLERAVGCMLAVGELAVEEIQQNIVSKDLLETGRMLTSVEGSEVSFTPTKATVQIRVRAPYASFQDEGTGVYAGGAPIVHPTGYFHFFWRREGGAETWLQEVQGTPKTQFFSDVIDDLASHRIREVWDAFR